MEFLRPKSGKIASKKMSQVVRSLKSKQPTSSYQTTRYLDGLKHIQLGKLAKASKGSW